MVSLLSGDIGDISEGDQVSVSCVAAANPPAAVIWYREGSGEIVSRQERLTINHIRREQAGVYVYQANNSVGQSQPRQIELAVQCEYSANLEKNIFFIFSVKYFEPEAVKNSDA